MNTPIWQPCCLCLGLLLFFSQCQKDALSSSQQDTPFIASKSQPILVDGATKSNELIQTQLGAVRVNPYTVANMTAAWNTLYPQHTVTALPATDLYMKFEPSNLEELRALEEAIAAFDYTANAEEDNDPFLVDYPLDQEVVVQGDYYQDPNYASDDVPPHYGVVKPDFIVPAGITATVLEELVLAPNASFLTIEAHRRLGLDYVGENGQVIELCDPSCPNFPHCLSTDVACSGGGIQPLAPPCAPGWGHWPRCLSNPPGIPGVPTTPPTFPTNACGCRISSDPKMPGGCVQVFDTQLDWQPVANVEIKVQHWLKCRRVFTADGCWRVGTSFSSHQRVHELASWLGSSRF